MVIVGRNVHHSDPVVYVIPLVVCDLTKILAQGSVYRWGEAAGILENVAFFSSTRSKVSLKFTIILILPIIFHMSDIAFSLVTDAGSQTDDAPVNSRRSRVRTPSRRQERLLQRCVDVCPNHNFVFS